MTDPDELLAELKSCQRRTASTPDKHCWMLLEEMTVAFTLLDEHLREGGKLPKDWATRKEG